MDADELRGPDEGPLAPEWFSSQRAQLGEHVTELYEYWSLRRDVVAAPKTGRNDPCPCHSGKKYKKCCLT